MARLIDHPRLLGLVCAAVAAGLGIAYLVAAGAPVRYLVVNLAALVLGCAAWLGLGRRPFPWNGSAVLFLAVPLAATALFGMPIESASRWVTVGPLSLQVSLIVLPAIIVLYARRADPIGTTGVLIAALALAAQPDRAMAGVLVAGTGAIGLARPGRLGALAFIGAVAAFAATMLQPDALPAVPFVDRILYTAFDVHFLAGAAVGGGCLVLLTPTLSAIRRMPERVVLFAFGASWATLIAAAAIGNYPTPVVGYGGSAVLGYLLSVALLPGARHLDPAVDADRASSQSTIRAAKHPFPPRRCPPSNLRQRSASDP